MRAAKVSAVHEHDHNGDQSVRSVRTRDNVRTIDAAERERRAWAGSLLAVAIEAAGLSVRSAAELVPIDESYLRRIIAGGPALSVPDLRRYPRRVVEQLLIRVLAEVRATAPSPRRAPLQLAKAAIDGAAAVLGDTVAGRPTRGAWMKLIAIAEEAIAAEGS